MTDPFWATFFTVVVGGAYTAWTTLKSKKGDQQSALITEYRTRLEKVEASYTEMSKEFQELREEVATLRGRDALWDFHATRVEEQVRGYGGEPYTRPMALRGEVQVPGD